MPNVVNPDKTLDPSKAKTVPLGVLAYGIREVESGGNYKIVNSVGATGAYQVLKSNIAEWTKQALGKSLSLDEWLNSPEDQDKVAIYKLGAYQKKYNSWEAAAALWFSGQPNPDSKASDGGNPVRQYVDKVGKAMKGGKSVGGAEQANSITDFLSGTGSGIVDSFKGAAKALVGIADSIGAMGTFAEFLMKLALPTTWIRIVCGFLGIGLLIFGLVVLGQEAKG